MTSYSLRRHAAPFRQVARKLALALFLSAAHLLIPAAMAADSPNSDLKALYEAEFSWHQAEMGKRLNDDQKWVDGQNLPHVNASRRETRLAYWEETLAKLNGIQRNQLSEEEQINADVFRQILETRISNHRYRTYEAPLNSDTFFWTGLYPRSGGFDSLQGYRDYLSRMRQLPRFFGEHMENMRKGLARGYSVPRITLEGRDRSIESFLASDQTNPFWAPLADIRIPLNADEKSQLQVEALDVIEQSVVPAYSNLLQFLREEYLPATRTSLSASDLPDGVAFYAAQIIAFTTLQLTPEEIHKSGLSEVDRIQREMLQTMRDADFDGTIGEFIEFLREDPRFYATTPEELMGYSSYVAKRVDARLGDTLGFLPRRRFTIMPVPDAIAPFYTSGRGGLDSCLMNTYNLPSRPLYTLAALTLHECAPGHALQAAISREAPGDIPEFREHNYFSGYGEGWGLYTEWLGVEMGIYRTPYEHFGRLSYEMWRACRLVIDTGIHHFGWSRQQAIDYLAERTALSIHEVTTEVDRYISWPGQALAYKLGEMLIREKRREAEIALGKNFDKRHFHDVILGLRSVPLTVLSNRLDQWIAAGGPDPYEKL